MNKKLMTLAVAGAFAAPAVAFAQASNVQIFGTIYMEYAYAKQGPIGAGAATAPGLRLEWRRSGQRRHPAIPGLGNRHQR